MQINHPPKRFYFDDGQFSFWEGLKKRQVYFIGGYSIDFDKEKELEKDIISVKRKYNLNPRHPVKWNLKDGKIVSYYKNENTLYQSLFKNSDKIREELLDIFSKYEITLYMSVIIRMKQKDKPKMSYQRCFTNLLQRIGMSVGFTDNYHSVFLDFFKEDATAIAESYSSGYHFGRDTEGNPYDCGSLSRKNFSEAIYFGKTIYNQFLQLADLVTGCTQYFLEYCLKDKEFKMMMKFFPKIMDKFHKNADGNPFRVGIVISPKTYYEKFERVFKQLKELQEFGNSF